MRFRQEDTHEHFESCGHCVDHAALIGTRHSACGIRRPIDHSSIFLLIAGSYTPFTLGVLGGAWGWALLGNVWALALIGITLKSIGEASQPIFSTGLYLMMGWLVLVAAGPLFDRVPLAGLLWLLMGGLFYTVGLVFYATDSHLRFGHLIWHFFVMAGTTCHYLAVLWYGT